MKTFKMDLLASNILKKKVECDSYAWAEGQRNKTIEAMQEYLDIHLKAYKNRINEKLSEYPNTYYTRKFYKLINE